MSFAKPELLWIALLALPELLLAALRTGGLRASVEYLVGPRRRARASAFYASSSFVGAAAAALFIASTALALAAPSWGRRGRAAERSGLELAFVLDVSRSMEARDGSPTRLADAKAIVRSLLRSSPGSAAGGASSLSFSLVAAKGDAVLLVPMTEDLEAVDDALEYAGPDTLTAKGTELGRGIAAGLSSFTRRGAGSRILILLSDGGESSRSARAAAEEAKRAQARFIAVGLGGSEAVLVPGASDPGGPSRPALDARGLPARSALDSSLLRSLAAAAEGRYLDGGDAGTMGALAAELAGARTGGSRIEYEALDRTGLFALLALCFLLVAILAELLAARGGRP